MEEEKEQPLEGHGQLGPMSPRRVFVVCSPWGGYTGRGLTMTHVSSLSLPGFTAKGKDKDKDPLQQLSTGHHNSTPD